MDASVLLLPELGLIEASEPRLFSTSAVEANLCAAPCHALRGGRRFGLPETGMPGLPLLADRSLAALAAARKHASAIKTL